MEMGEVYIMYEGRIVKIDLESETGFSEVDWDEADLEYDDDDEEEDQKKD